MEPPREARIVASWTKNVSQWTRSVRQQQIESRTLVTNQAIVDAIVQHSPQAVLDIGCGEGWLIRALAPHVSTRIGVDAVPGLIELARAAGGGVFRVASYADLAFDALDEDVVLWFPFGSIASFDVEPAWIYLAPQPYGLQAGIAKADGFPFDQLSDWLRSARPS
jgi:SAM-dependent methyltransferase